jgi:hypothetical protein
MSIFISVIPVVEQTDDIDDGEAACLKIDIRHQRLHERHQPGAGGRLDLQDILRWQVQHRSHPADLSAVGRGSSQSDQLPVVELTLLRRLLIGLDGSNQQCAARSLDAGPVDKLGKPHQQPAGVIASRSHREDAVAAFLPKCLTGGKSPLRLISAELHRNLAMYAVRSSDDTDDYVNGSLRSRRISVHHSFRLLHAPWRLLAATASGAAASQSVNVDEVDAYALIAGQRADHRTESGCSAPRAADDLADIVGIHPYLEHPPATEILFLDCDIVRMRDDPANQMLKRFWEH